MSNPDKTREILMWLFVLIITVAASIACFGQCPTHSLGMPLVDTQCYEDSLSVSDTLIYDCPSYYHGGGFIYEFTSTGALPISIIVESNLSYVSCPTCEVWCHAFIIDECGGNTIWSTSTGNCGGVAIWTTAPSTDWILDIQLDAGTYYLVIGNVGAYQINWEINGCFTVMIGEQGVLSNIIEQTPNGLVVRNKFGTFDLLGRKIK